MLGIVASPPLLDISIQASPTQSCPLPLPSHHGSFENYTVGPKPLLTTPGASGQNLLAGPAASLALGPCLGWALPDSLGPPKQAGSPLGLELHVPSISLTTSLASL